MPKSTKRFVISDDSLNKHGYRVLTAGVEMDQFIKNPIMLWMHGRAWDDRSPLPLGHWQDIEVKNGQITAVPFFSDDDEFAMSIYKKVEEETIRMASAGLDPIETSEDEKYLLPSQRFASVTKSILLEASLVDMGSNYNACTLYKDGAEIKLSASDKNSIIPLIQKKTNMNPQLMALAIMLGLGKEATEVQLAEKLTTQHADFLQLSKDNQTLTQAHADLKAKFEAFKKETSDKEVNATLTLAVKEGKITEAQKPDFVALAASGNLDAVKTILDKMPAHTSAQAQLAAAAGGDNADPILKLSFDEAHKTDKLSAIKEKYPERYKEIFKVKYGKEPKA